MIVPAFNEAAGIGNLLTVLTQLPEFGSRMEVIVAPNGCSDRTAEVSRSYGVRVVEVHAASKTAALNAADAVATGDVRIYMDADVPVDGELIRKLAAAIAQPGVEAAVPHPRIDTSASSWLVQAYYAINSRLPVFRGRLFGRGIIAVSAHARSRFVNFPEITADDMVLDAIMGADEKVEIDSHVRVVAPVTSADLIRRVARARDGNAEFWRFAESAPQGFPRFNDPVAGPKVTSWLRSVVLRAPWLLPAAVAYVAVVLLAERKRRSASWDVRSGWGRPADSTQSAAAAVPTTSAVSTTSAAPTQPAQIPAQRRPLASVPADARE